MGWRVQGLGFGMLGLGWGFIWAVEGLYWDAIGAMLGTQGLGSSYGYLLLRGLMGLKWIGWLRRCKDLQICVVQGFGGMCVHGA